MSFHILTVLFVVISVKKIDSTPNSRAQGCLFGLAVGDAQGAPFDMDFPIQQTSPGTISHSTEFTLASAWSLIRQHGFNREDLAKSYLYLYREDWTVAGGAMQDSLKRGDVSANNNEHVLEKYANKGSLGNGFLMRMASFGIAGIGWTEQVTCDNAASDCKLTHGNIDAQAASRAFVAAIRAGIRTGKADEMFKAAERASTSDLVFNTLQAAQSRVLPVFSSRGDITDFKGDNRGYFGIAFQNAFAHLRSRVPFRVAIESTIGRGGKTAVNCAVLGALYGALLGVEAIPHDWRLALVNAKNNLLPTSNTGILSTTATNLIEVGDPQSQIVVPPQVDALVDDALRRSGSLKRARSLSPPSVIAMSFADAMQQAYRTTWVMKTAKPLTHAWHIMDRSHPTNVNMRQIRNAFAQTELTKILDDPVSASRAVYLANFNMYEVGLSEPPTNWINNSPMRAEFSDPTWTYLLQTRTTDDFLQRVLRLGIKHDGDLIVERWNGEPNGPGDIWSSKVTDPSQAWKEMEDVEPFRIALEYPTTRIPLMVKFTQETKPINEHFRVKLCRRGDPLCPPVAGCDVQGWAEQVSAVKSRGQPLRFELCYGLKDPSVAAAPQWDNGLAPDGPSKLKWTFTPDAPLSPKTLLQAVTQVMESTKDFVAEDPNAPPTYFLHGSPSDPSKWKKNDPLAPQLWTTAWQKFAKHIDTSWALAYHSKWGQPGYLSVWRRNPRAPCVVKAHDFSATLDPDPTDLDKVHARIGYYHLQPGDTYDAYVFPTSAAVWKCQLDLFQTIQVVSKGVVVFNNWDAQEEVSQPLVDPDAAAEKWDPCIDYDPKKVFYLENEQRHPVDAERAQCQQDFYHTLTIKKGDPQPTRIDSRPSYEGTFQRIPVSKSRAEAIKLWYRHHPNNDPNLEIRVIRIYPAKLLSPLNVIHGIHGFQLLSVPRAGNTPFSIDLVEENKNMIQCEGKQKKERAVSWADLSTHDALVILEKEDDDAKPQGNPGGRGARAAQHVPAPSP